MFASELIKWVTPPLIISLLSGIKELVTPKEKEVIFRGDSKLFEDILSNANVYGEYGCGASTLWVCENTNAEVVAVDTSYEWAEHVLTQLEQKNRVDISVIDLGELGDWGRPLTYQHRNRFKSYITGIWEKPTQPDVILIDGRFRVACFLHSLVEAKQGAIIIFDDYRDRKKYHVVEEFCKPYDFCGEQAMFRVPEHLDEELILSEVDRFTYVID